MSTQPGSRSWVQSAWHATGSPLPARQLLWKNSTPACTTSGPTAHLLACRVGCQKPPTNGLHPARSGQALSDTHTTQPPHSVAHISKHGRCTSSAFTTQRQAFFHHMCSTEWQALRLPGRPPAGKSAEELGQGEAIAVNLREMFGFRVPIISVVIGEGGSGGALAIGCANRCAFRVKFGVGLKQWEVLSCIISVVIGEGGASSVVAIGCANRCAGGLGFGLVPYWLSAAPTGALVGWFWGFFQRGQG
jgi:hypothetical protein